MTRRRHGCASVAEDWLGLAALVPGLPEPPRLRWRESVPVATEQWPGALPLGVVIDVHCVHFCVGMNQQFRLRHRESAWLSSGTVPPDVVREVVHTVACRLHWNWLWRWFTCGMLEPDEPTLTRLLCPLKSSKLWLRSFGFGDQRGHWQASVARLWRRRPTKINM